MWGRPLSPHTVRVGARTFPPDRVIFIYRCREGMFPIPASMVAGRNIPDSQNLNFQVAGIKNIYSRYLNFRCRESITPHSRYLDFQVTG